MSEKGINPLVSIIVPVYKVEEYLERCVNSIISQSYSNLEIILVDDGSPDRSSEICDKYAEQDHRIHVIHQKNQGQSVARNNALNNAHGAYIAFIDSDDYVSNLYIEHLMYAISGSSSDIAICDYVLKKLDGNNQQYSANGEEGLITKKEFWRLEGLCNTMYCIALWNKIFKAEIWQDLRFQEGKYAEDGFVLTEYIQKANKYFILKEPLYYYCQRSDSLVNHYSLKNLDSVESRLKRAELYHESGEIEIMRNCLSHVRALLSVAYRQLDLKDAATYERYSNLREWYRQLYCEAYPKLELTSKGIKNALYKHSDRIYGTIVKVLHKD